MLRSCLIALALLAALAAPAQQPATSNQQLAETYSVGYVMIPFTVFGSHGVPITDLGEREVQLDVDGTPVRTDLFEVTQNAPISFTILIDGSGSMALGGKLDAARAAVAALLAHRHPGDDFAVYLFSDGEATELVPFTDDAAKITSAVAGIKPYGKTAFFDALATMPERSRLGRNPTRAIILLSDGIDNASKLTRDAIARQLEGVGIPIFPLGLRDASEQLVLRNTKLRDELSDVVLLEDVAAMTGARLYLGTHPEQLNAAVENLEKGLRAQYLIGFTPTGKGAVKYRRISLKLAGRVRSTQVRAGYRGTEPPVLSTASARAKSKRNERKGS